MCEHGALHRVHSQHSGIQRFWQLDSVIAHLLPTPYSLIHLWPLTQSRYSPDLGNSLCSDRLHWIHSPWHLPVAQLDALKGEGSNIPVFTVPGASSSLWTQSHCGPRNCPCEKIHHSHLGHYILHIPDFGKRMLPLLVIGDLGWERGEKQTASVHKSGCPLLCQLVYLDSKMVGTTVSSPERIISGAQTGQFLSPYSGRAACLQSPCACPCFPPLSLLLS